MKSDLVERTNANSSLRSQSAVLNCPPSSYSPSQNMAICHFSAKVISRGDGKSSTAAAAYRSGEQIVDERTGLIFDYGRKERIYSTKMLAPPNAPNWASNRQQLWNRAELFETRINSRTAREFVLALPVELDNQAKCDLVEEWVNDKFVELNLVADIAYHNFDTHNPHCHIMITTRTLNSDGFNQKVRELDKKDFILKSRQSWCNYTNTALEKAGSPERIDPRTLEEQGITDRIAQVHLGPNVIAMAQKGTIKPEYTNIKSRYDKFKSIEAHNLELKAKKAEQEKRERREAAQLLKELHDLKLKQQREQQDQEETAKREEADRKLKADQEQQEREETARKLKAEQKLAVLQTKPLTVQQTTKIKSKQGNKKVINSPTPPAASIPPQVPTLQTTNNELTDTELLAKMKLLNQWLKDSPPAPNSKKREELEIKLIAQGYSLNKLSISIDEHEEFLSSHRPRSLLNLFGVNSKLYEEKEIRLAIQRRQYDELENQRKIVLSKLSSFQTYETEYKSWLSSFQTQEMLRLQQQLNSPELKKRIEALKNLVLDKATTLNPKDKLIINHQPKKPKPTKFKNPQLEL